MDEQDHAEHSPLLDQAVNKLFYLPWPRKPLNKAKSGNRGQGQGRSGHVGIPRGSRPKRSAAKFF